jgi:hypothetical protein
MKPFTMRLAEPLAICGFALAAWSVGCAAEPRSRTGTSGLDVDCTPTETVDVTEPAPSSCRYVLLDGRCYDSAETACTCTGCATPCRVTTSVPPQVVCPADAGAVSDAEPREEGPPPET